MLGPGWFGWWGWKPTTWGKKYDTINISLGPANPGLPSREENLNPYFTSWELGALHGIHCGSSVGMGRTLGRLNRGS